MTLQELRRQSTSLTPNSVRVRHQHRTISLNPRSILAQSSSISHCLDEIFLTLPIDIDDRWGGGRPAHASASTWKAEVTSSIDRRQQILAAVRTDPGITIEQIRQQAGSLYRRDDLINELVHQGLIYRQRHEPPRADQLFPVARVQMMPGHTERGVVVVAWVSDA